MNVMRQTWNQLSFLHWRYDPAVVRPLVPSALELDLYDGAAWVGLVPFHITDLTLPRAPAIPHLSTFPETNVRTYVRDRTGGAGVWFFSLDAARLLAVLGARIGYALPYFWARMQVESDRAMVHYRSRRIHAPDAISDIAIEIGRPIVATDLEIFLTMRLRLYAQRFHRIWKADIVHSPWPLQSATLIHCRESLIQAAALPAPVGPPLLHYAEKLDVSVGPLVPL